jgi:hypothetical protein
MKSSLYVLIALNNYYAGGNDGQGEDLRGGYACYLMEACYWVDNDDDDVDCKPGVKINQQ